MTDHKPTKSKPKAPPSAVKFTQCRTLGHSWVRDADTSWAPDFGFPMVFVCTQCGTRRFESWSRVTGELLMRRYVHPLGFRMSKDEKLSRSTWRVIFLDREGL